MISKLVFEWSHLLLHLIDRLCSRLRLPRPMPRCPHPCNLHTQRFDILLFSQLLIADRDLVEDMVRFQQKKLHDVKVRQFDWLEFKKCSSRLLCVCLTQSMMKDMLYAEMVEHARAMEVLSRAYDFINKSNDADDLKVRFKKTDKIYTDLILFK